MSHDFFTALFTQPVPRGTAAERRLAKYARYRASQRGWERTYRYNNGVAHQQACERWRLSHIRGPESYQDHNGRWRGLMKVDPADRAEAQRVFANDGGGLTAAQRLIMDLGHDADILRDEEAWNRAHARFGKEFSCEEVREFWTKKHRRWEAREARGRA